MIKQELTEYQRRQIRLIRDRFHKELKELQDEYKNSESKKEGN